MASDPVLVYLHGVGGVRPGWAENLLDDQPADGRFDRVRIVAPSYVSILSGDAAGDAAGDVAGEVPATREARIATVDPHHRAAYRQRQRELADRVARCRDVVPAGLAWPSILPRPGRWPIADFLDSPARFIGGLDQARRYVRDSALRRRVLDHVMSHVGPVWAECSGPIVLIGHSLGAVVALDVLAEFDQPIDMLVTVGAPLGHPDMSERLVDRGIDLARLGRWLNVVHLLDPVPLGRGASEMFPAATDVYLPVLAGGHGVTGLGRGLMRAATAHLDSTYLSSDVVRTVVGEALAAPGGAMWSTPQDCTPSSVS